VKTIVIALLLISVALWAQVPVPQPGAATSTNQDEALRQALRRTIQGRTNPTVIVPLSQTSGTNPAVPATPPTVDNAVPVPAPTTVVIPPTTPPPAVVVTTNPPVVIPTNPAGSNAPGNIIVAPNPPAAPPTPNSETVAVPPTTPSSLSTNASAEEVVPALAINFAAVDINEVMKVYAEYVNRTILRPTQLPGIITLRNQTPLTKREVIQALDAVLALNGVSVIPIGEKFIKVVGSERVHQMAGPFNERKGKDLPDIGSYVTHVMQLKHVKPSEIVTALQPFASSIANAILPIDSSSIVVLRDYTENVKRMLELIEKIDIDVPSEFVSEVIPIKYALASEISAALNSLSSGGGGTTVGSSPGGAAQGGATSRRSTSPFGTQRTLGSGGYGGGFGNPGYYPQAAQPAQPVAPGTSDFSGRLRNIIQRASGTSQIQVIGETKIIADERTNSLLIFAGRSDMEIIKKIISQLDVVLAQVLIETVIMEVTLGPDIRNFGFSYLQRPQSSGNFTGVGSAGAGQFLNPGSFAGAVGTNATSGLAGGFNYLFSYRDDLDVTITALESANRAKVLQKPRIQTSHAVPANIFVGESRPYPQGSYYGGGSFGGYSTIQQLQIGVTLEVTPLINPDGLVVMDIHQTIENFAGFTEITGVGQVPITTRKEATAKVAVRDRDTIMLGGLIENDKSKSGSGVPFLMDIPLLGYLFRSSSSSETRKELIVLIRPTVLPTPEIAALTAEAEKHRMPGVRQTEQEVYQEEADRIRNADKKLLK
jgi:general secretion pathway protein D